MITETKPRKAKYGFKAYLSWEMLLMAGDLIKEGSAGQPESEETWWHEMPNSMGRVDLLIYINDDIVYERFKTAISARTKSGT